MEVKVSSWGGGGYIPANYLYYHPEDEASGGYDYTNNVLPSKSNSGSGLLNGTVVDIKDNMGPNYMDKNDDTQIVYSRSVTIDDGAGSETLALFPILPSHKEMFKQIKVGDKITYYIHELANYLPLDRLMEFGRIFPEDVETYGNFVNDRDFIYKWATGNKDMTGERFVQNQIDNELELGGEQFIMSPEIYSGTAYTGGPSALETVYNRYEDNNKNDAFLLPAAERTGSAQMASADGANSGGARAAKVFLAGTAAVHPKLAAFVRALEKSRAPRSSGSPERQIAAVPPKKYRNARGV